MVRQIARLKHAWRDVALAAAFVIIGAVLARSVLLAQPRPVFFYEMYFAGSVLEACGLGFKEYADGHSPPVLDDFLARRTMSLSCDALPTDRPLRPAGWMAVAHRYLAWTMTALWRLGGVNWHVLTAMFGLAAGAVAAAAFVIGRLSMNRVWASAFALAVATSGLNLAYLTWFRDYSKAPFLLASLALCGWLVTRVRTPRALITLGVLEGLVVGIGFGFRTDVLLAVPLFAFVVVALLPRGVGLTLKWRVAALAAFLLVFVVVAAPMLRGYGRGGNMSHVVLLGLAQPFNKPLGVTPPHYLVSPTYWDYQTEVQTRTYVRALGGDDWAAESTVLYDRATTRYLRDVVATLPADVLVRTYAAVLTTFRTSSWPTTLHECWTLRGTLAGAACRARDQFLRPLRHLPLLPAVLFIVVLAAVPFRQGAFLITALMAYAGAATLQYDPRHTFHLEVVPLWTLAFAGQHLWGVAHGMRQGLTAPSGLRWSVVRSWTTRIALAIAAVVVVPAGTLMLVRTWQDRQLTYLFERYEAVDVEPIAVTWQDALPGVRRFALDDVMPGFATSSAEPPTVRAEILRITLGGESCAGRELVMTLPYRTTFEVGSLTLPAIVRWQVPSDGTSTQVFVPVYRALVGKPTETRPTGEFLTPGLDVAAGDAACVQSIARVQQPTQFPIQFVVDLPANWRDLPHHQRLATLGGAVGAP